MALKEDVDVEELRINLALLEAEPQEESRAQSLAAAIALITFGSILWTVLGFVCVHKLASAYNFKESVCYIEEHEEFVANKTCNCIEAPECSSLYPCIRLSAVFQTESDTSVEVIRGVLYDTIYDVNSECSFAPPCSRNKDNNIQAVHSFITGYRGNTNVSCYYNPNDYDQIVLRPNSHVMDLFHAVFWPLVIVLVGFAMFYRFCRSFRKKGFT